MKAIIGGVMLKGYLSIKTLIVKMIGICLTIGSGLPFGKEVEIFIIFNRNFEVLFSLHTIVIML